MAKKVMKSICDRCHCACGVLVHMEGEKILKIEGDQQFPQNEGMMCPKGLALTQLIYHPDRIRYPMKRAGERGSGKWQRISWDEALDMAAEGFGEAIKKYGPQSVSWSWGDAGFRSLVDFKQLFLYSIGSFNHFHSDAHYCHSPVLVANKMIFGERVTSETGPDYRNSRCMMLWGGNPVASHPTRARDIMIGKRRGGKLIVIDPRFTEIASKADLYLQLRPATDGALALGMLNVIINEELYDKKFVKDWCVGFERLKERVQEYPVEKVSEITWVPKDQIIKAARMFALNKPAVVHTRIGVQMSITVNATIRAISIMAAICGNLDIKGGHLFPNHPRPVKSRRDVERELLSFPDPVKDKVIGAKEFPLFSGSNSMVGNYPHPPSMIHAIIEGHPYAIKALWHTNDLLLALEDTAETRKAIDNLDFIVGSDFIMTPMMELSDLILPPCTYLARNDIEHIFYDGFIAARPKLIEPEFETMDERTIDLEILRRMKIRFPKVFETVENYLDYCIQGLGITFKELAERHIVLEEIRYKKYEKTGFNTPSGKVEIYSSIAEKHGYDPLPYYQENPETPVTLPEVAKEYPLILITGARVVTYYHGANRELSWLREINPYPSLEIHPTTASKIGIKNGDWVWIEAPFKRGRVKQKARLTEGIDPRVVSAPSHWWYPENKSDPMHGVYESNINVITSNGPPYEPVTGATPLRGSLCKVYRCTDSEIPHFERSPYAR
ncbi:MAG: molybdopterin-dependent oxidoreductase [Candidatus Bathyarchaeia archaeon]